jgi:hypothetical protein
MYKSNTPGREEVVADLIVPDSTSIVRILVSAEGSHLTSITLRHSTGTGACVDRDHDHLLREFMEGIERSREGGAP